MFTLPIQHNLKKKQAKYKEFKIKFNDMIKNKKLSKFNELRNSVVSNSICRANSFNLSDFNKKEVSKHRETTLNEYR